MNRKKKIKALWIAKKKWNQKDNFQTMLMGKHEKQQKAPMWLHKNLVIF